ncbi:beta-glucosidase family protein [Sphingopyxis sp. MSC1_008]|jgi:beta-glucosidase|uniref:beta-glucosidase family protein n=1 Tax=Sphingopyxis sp. MSC1_008 TaxID=2909265 RepID=UPI0020BE2FC5|nr:glycoside hydrolase family 3 protein [Sphingopyxis sp. MSC1_008]
MDSEDIGVTVAAADPQARRPAGDDRDEEMDDARRAAERLVSQMTLDEKMGFVISYFPLISRRAKEYEMIPSSGFTPGLPRLGIPALTITDASLGVANTLNARVGDTATALPAALATGATFDVGLARSGGAMIGSEARAKGFNVMLAGGINLTRDPWCGRNFEYVGEDPLLSGRLGGAAVAGVQSNHIAATVKHFVLNAQETGRMILDARIDATDLRESDLLAFEIAIEIGKPASVMTGYNKINGDYAGEHGVLINEILKGDWGYPGWVMSDWGAVHSTEKAALAGLDQESGIELDWTLNGAIFFTDRLKDALAAGRVPEARLDDMVARILTGLIKVGALDFPLAEAPQPLPLEANAAVAQAVAEAGTVLLRNEGGVLPLAGDIARIAVIGGNADVGVLSGGGSSQVRSHGGAPIEKSLETGDAAWFCRETYHASSPLLALRERLPGADIRFDDGSDREAAARLAAASDVAVIFAVQWQTEAVDALTLALPGEQDALIEAVAAANPKTVVVLETGGPILMPWLERVAAILEAWYPGQRGGEAIARLLLGDANPSGRLPITFPATDDQAPRPKPAGLAELRARDAALAAGQEGVRIAPFPADYVEGANAGYRWYEMAGRSPLFPFGFGLSYTSFEHAGLAIAPGDKPQVLLDVTNIGARGGADVPQVYVRAPDRNGTETWRLAGFARVELAPGESRRVAIELDPRTYSNWDDQAGEWRHTATSPPLAVGRSATDFTLRGILPPG